MSSEEPPSPAGAEPEPEPAPGPARGIVRRWRAWRAARVAARSGAPRLAGIDRVNAWGVILGIFLGILGLFANGAATYYSGRATSDQGATTKDQFKREQMAQARLVDLVPAGEFTSRSLRVTLVNRSQEPVSRVKLYIAFAAAQHDKTHGFFDYEVWGTVYPCTQVTFDLRAIAVGHAQTARDDMSGDGGSLFDYGVVFTDAAGKTWHRHPSGFVNGTPWLEPPSDGTRSPLLPDAFKEYHPLAGARVFTLPTAAQKPFVVGGPRAASACDDPESG